MEDQSVSIIILYYNRIKLLTNTLLSIAKYSGFIYCEVLIIDDASDSENKLPDLSLIYPNVRVIRIEPENKDWSCPSKPVNLGIAKAKGDIIIIQGAEIQHKGDILADVQRIKDNDYFVYACQSLNEKGQPDVDNVEWYQHSQHNPRCYHFCTAIKRADLLDLGGMDERYGAGIAYGDDDFVRRVRIKGMNIVQIDNPYTVHQWHKPMQEKPKGSAGMCDKELFDYICKHETGYRVYNSYL